MAFTRAQLKDLFGVHFHIHKKFAALIDSVWNMQDDGAGGGAASYLVYTAKISQAGTAAPTVDIVLENTLGTPITWTRSSIGVYLASKTTGTFSLTKTIGFFGIPGNTDQLANQYTKLIGDVITGGGNIGKYQIQSSDTLDDRLFRTIIELREYP